MSKIPSKHKATIVGIIKDLVDGETGEGGRLEGALVSLDDNDATLVIKFPSAFSTGATLTYSGTFRERII